ncbi:hypothetical protein D3C79_844970 [compost metagenome]
MSSVRNLATSPAFTASPWFPQLVRMKLTTSATSWSLNRQPNAGMVKFDGAVCVAGTVPPASTTWISEVASAVCTTGLPANAGNTRV